MKKKAMPKKKRGKWFYIITSTIGCGGLSIIGLLFFLLLVSLCDNSSRHEPRNSTSMRLPKLNDITIGYGTNKDNITVKTDEFIAGNNGYIIIIYEWKNPPQEGTICKSSLYIGNKQLSQHSYIFSGESKMIYRNFAIRESGKGSYKFEVYLNDVFQETTEFDIN